MLIRPPERYLATAPPAVTGRPVIPDDNGKTTG
jgi:hypothetical protein